MAEFTWVESASTELSEEPKLARTQFGDGYVEVAPVGLHPITQSWTVQFRDVDNAVADQIIAFFRARITAFEAENFDWTPLWGTTAIKVRCLRWSRTHSETWGESHISATFEQDWRI